MSEISVTQRGQTRNQSTADYQVNRPFIWNNKFQTGVFTNNSGGSLTFPPCSLVARHLTVAGALIPVTSSNLADIIGISSQEGSLTLANAATAQITYCYEGGIDVNLLVLPAGVTLDTMVGNKALRDILAGVGFELDNTTTSMTTFDN
jgi:hypothetical protein